MVAPHFKVDEGTWPANVVIVGTDPAVYAAEAAKAICAELDGKTGSVAVTQGNFNTTENLVSETFTLNPSVLFSNPLYLILDST